MATTSAPPKVPTVITYIWLPRTTNRQKNVGHASMAVGENTYVSWWPEESAGLGRDFYPIRNKNYASDVGDEGCDPDHAIRLDGLNTAAILRGGEDSDWCEVAKSSKGLSLHITFCHKIARPWSPSV